MSKAIKELVGRDYESRYSELDSALVVSVHGLTGIEINTFRAELGKSEAEVHVIHNRLMRRAVAGKKLAPLIPLLKGPCAFVTGGPGTIDNAKELQRLTKDYPALELKFGVLDGEDEALSIDDISKRKTKVELQSELVGLAVAPGRRIAGCLKVGGRVAGCIKSIVDRLEKGEAIEKVA